MNTLWSAEWWALTREDVLAWLERIVGYIEEFRALTLFPHTPWREEIECFLEKTKWDLYALSTVFTFSQRLFFPSQFLEDTKEVCMPFAGMEHDLSFGSYVFEWQSDEVTLALMGIKLRIWETTIIPLLRSRFSEPNGYEMEIQTVLNTISHILID